MNVKLPWDIGTHQPALESIKYVFSGSVLDVGSGVCDNSIWISNLPDVKSVTCVEKSHDAVKKAIRKLERLHNSKISILLGDIYELAKSIGSFDTILDSAFFHCIPDYDQKRYLEVITPCIKIGGKYVMLVSSDTNPDPWDPPLPRRINADYVSKLWSSMGWNIEFISTDKFYNLIFKNHNLIHALLMVATRRM
jgi:SAM-dependent methyltransferase